jgi:hypothetical protein
VKRLYYQDEDKIPLMKDVLGFSTLNAEP